MKLLIVRHGDPNYAIDSLTPTGWKEAELLSHRLSKLDVKAFYVSPMGRARDTAAATLTKMGRDAEVQPWLREFLATMIKPGETEPTCLWDWLPSVWTKDPMVYDHKHWMEAPLFAGSNAAEEANWVYEGLDGLLARHGYVRDGEVYRVEQANEDTIVLFCHFGLGCVLLGHLLHISPVLLWHGACAAPTSVTTVITEERRPGVAHFRMASYGDTSHLYVADQEPSPSARFCETYDSPGQRRD